MKRFLKKEEYGKSSLIIFNEVCKKEKPDKATINKYFDEFVERGDYLPSMRDTLLEQCYELAS